MTLRPPTTGESTPATRRGAGNFLARRLLVVPAESLAHGGKGLVGEVVQAAGGEPGEERGGEHGSRHALVDRRDRGPAALAGGRDPARVLLEPGPGEQRPGGK